MQKEESKKKRRRGRGEGSIRFLEEKGLWQARYPIGANEKGKTIYKSIYGKKNEKGKLLARMRNALTALGKGEYVDPSDKTLIVWCREWYRDYKEPTIKRKNTRGKYERSLTKVEKADIANMRLKDFKGPEPIQKYYNSLAKQGLSAETIKIINTFINGAFKKAKKLKMISENPVDDVVIPKTESYEEECTEKVRALTTTEYEVFMKELYRRSRYFMFAHFMSQTGLRPGETIALDIKDLLFESNQVKVHKTALRNKRGEERKTQNKTKTQSSKRITPVPEETMKLMKKHILTLKNKSPDAPLFQTKEGTRLHDRNALRAFKEIGKDVGLEWVNLHTMRHTFASRLFKEGVDIKTISELLGHKNVSTTYDIYIHFIDNTVEKSVQVLNSDVNIPESLPEKTKRKTKPKGKVINLKKVSSH